MDRVFEWVDRATVTIDTDPSFWIIYNTVPEEAYPWETLELSTSAEDSAVVALEAFARDAQTSYGIYAFLHLMHRVGRMDEWFPEASDLRGYELERFIVEKTADSWLLGRSIYDTTPYPPLDEIVYAADAGFLDALLLTARPEEFDAIRESYEADNPGKLLEYAEWFRGTFGRPPPGQREG